MTLTLAEIIKKDGLVWYCDEICGSTTFFKKDLTCICVVEKNLDGKKIKLLFDIFYVVCLIFFFFTIDVDIDLMKKRAKHLGITVKIMKNHNGIVKRGINENELNSNKSLKRILNEDTTITVAPVLSLNPFTPKSNPYDIYVLILENANKRLENLIERLKKGYCDKTYASVEIQAIRSSLKGLTYDGERVRLVEKAAEHLKEREKQRRERLKQLTNRDIQKIFPLGKAPTITAPELSTKNIIEKVSKASSEPLNVIGLNRNKTVINQWFM